ncbi:MAG: hypothetical protein JNM27_05145 [Leptospirales bacterium]|nr:hypothetical protein [Leptospirales bacterium]
MFQLFVDSPAYVWQTRREETLQPFSCDGFLKDPDDVLFRAISVAADNVTLFNWLCQLRVAPYSYDWIDNGFKQSPRIVDPSLRLLEVGQVFVGIFKLLDFKADEFITLGTFDSKTEGYFGKVVLTYAIRKPVNVAPDDPGCRLVAKLIVKRRQRGIFKMLAPLLPLGDWIMMQKQLRTLRDLAEGRC